MNKQMLTAFNKMYNHESFAQRADKGSMGELLVTGDSWIIKQDKSGIEGCKWEAVIYELLKGLQLAPDYDAKLSNVKSYPGTIYIKQIANGVTLLEYVEAYRAGMIELGVLVDVLNATKKLLTDFWSKEFVHGDLHGRNIVIGMNQIGDKWRPYLIDFGTTYHPKVDSKFRECLFWGDESTPSIGEDWQKLAQSIGEDLMSYLE